MMGSELGRLTSRGDRVDNDRRQERERQQAAQVAIADSLGRREFGDTPSLPRDECLETALST